MGIVKEIPQIENSRQRLHGIDALRGIAMLLGILLHATIPYKSHPLPNWPQDINFQHWFFDFIYFLIHSFRMPLFFLIAGYFCRFLLYKVGVKEFIRLRAKRILVPFIASLILILPLTIFPFLVYQQSLKHPGEWNLIFKDAGNDLLGWNGMAHLWFLYYLILYYVGVVLLFKIRKHSSIRKILTVIIKQFDRLPFGSITGVLVTGLPVCIILLMVPELYLNVDTGAIPAPPYLMFFGYFFLLGWFINKKAVTFFNWVSTHTWYLLSAGMALSILLFYAEYFGYYKPGSINNRILIKLVAGITVILLVFGSVGFFLKYCKSENKVWKYISDASYWMYLIHLAVICGLQVFMIQFNIPGYLKFPIVFSITLLITLITYHYFVRYSVLGEFLHGKREKSNFSLFYKLI